MQNDEILKILRQNKSEGIKLLFDRYYRPLVLYANEYVHSQETSEDIVQEFFIRLWEDCHLEKISFQTLSAYLYTSIRNACYTYVHSKSERIQKIQLEEIDIAANVSEEMNDYIVERINQVISHLPPQTASIVDCILIQEMKYQEAADKLQISVNTVKSLLKKGMKTIREELKEEKRLLFYFFVLKFKSKSPVFLKI